MRFAITHPITRRLGWALVGILVGVLILGAIDLTVKTRQTTQNTNRTAKAVLDCTTPGGKCFKRGRRATAKAVGDINRVIVLAAACADRPGDQTREQIERCVLDALTARP